MWESNAHDSRVLNDAIIHGLPLPQGKHYLAEAGYSLSQNCLTPFRGVRYHLNEWKQGGRRPQNAKELFNVRHSSLRNIIERSFGIIKKPYAILRDMPSFPYFFQCDIVLCAFMVHNFIRLNQRYDEEYVTAEEEAGRRINECLVECLTLSLTILLLHVIG